MADEPIVPTGEEPVVEEPVVEEPVVPAPVEEPGPAVRALQEKLAQYEQLVLSPEYAEFLQNKAGGRPRQPDPAPVTSAQREEFVERLNSMPRAEFATFIRDVVMKEVQEQMFGPLAQSVAQEKVQQQVVQCVQKYPDFWSHKDAMLGISQSNPNLNAEQVYLLAKGVTAAPKKPPAKPTEVPGGSPPGGPKPKDSLPFKDAFDEAFKKSGLPK